MGKVSDPLGSAGAGAAAFLPSSVAGLVLWLKADTLTALGDGASIGAANHWTDQSGNGNDATVGTATLKLNILNALPVVRFNGTSNYLKVARNAGLEPNHATVFAVFRGTVAPAPSSYLLSKLYTTGGASSYAIQKDQVRVFDYIGGSLIASSAYTGTVWDGTGRSVMSLADGVLLDYYFGGAAQANLAGAGSINYDAGDLYFGAYDGTQLWWQGDIAEVLIYNTALNLADSGRVQSYLKTKWGL